MREVPLPRDHEGREIPLQPDTFEGLLEDLGRAADALNYEACAYFDKSACDCSLCIADKGGTC